MRYFGFWIFMSVCVACDAWLYSKGHDGFFFEHKTVVEKRIQEAQLNEMERKDGE